MRLDAFLSDTGILSSRTEAKRYIEEGYVSVLGKVIIKPSFNVTGIQPSDISVSPKSDVYVSRGGYKLKAALESFNIDVNERIALDIGASSGGFTDCLLQNGAKHVIAVDSGHGQLNARLVEDKRVTSIEGYNARYLKREDFKSVPDLAVMDVSFISATLIIPSVYSVLGDNSDFICLIKPQFEVGRSGISKGGIVKNENLRQYAIDKVVSSAVACGFEFCSSIRSPIEGGDGNVEFLGHFRKKESNI